ncbi:RNA polymerase sigma factor [Streptomyces niveus]|uniref:RNA polymerase sigma factor n=1 Tax=Streptomyces niveus TaxID=193462 RepID=UPI0036AE369C
MSDLDAVFKQEYGKVAASLARRFGDLDLAEEAVSEALVAAVEHWQSGLPPNPGGWLTTAATRKALDRLRRESARDTKQREALMLVDDSPTEPTGPVVDDRLRLVFICCHPALAPEARVALTLRLLGGLTVADIARAFLVPETTMAQRLTRAKAKIKKARIPYRVPVTEDLAPRLSTVLAVLYLIFNEGYLAGTGEAPVRRELTAEAIRLARLLHVLLPEEPEVAGLLALLLLSESRVAARFDEDGELVPLGEQDRSGWDRDLIAEGHALVRACLRVNRPGRYQLLAAVNAVHTDAPAASATDWGQITALYDRLYALEQTPVVALNRAIAVAEVDGPAVALAQVDELPLDGYHAWHATRADLLRRLGRSAEARAAYDAAIAATQNPGERAYLARRRGSLAPSQTAKPPPGGSPHPN